MHSNIVSVSFYGFASFFWIVGRLQRRERAWVVNVHSRSFPPGLFSLYSMGIVFLCQFLLKSPVANT